MHQALNPGTSISRHTSALGGSLEPVVDIHRGGAEGVFTPGLDGHMAGPGDKEVGAYQIGDGAEIVHLEPGLHAAAAIVAEQGMEHGASAVEGGQRCNHLAGQGGPAGDIESAHHDGQAAAEDDVGRFGIHVDIELGIGGVVAPTSRAHPSARSVRSSPDTLGAG